MLVVTDIPLGLVQESTQRSNDANHKGADVRTIQLNSEIYVNSFDLFQKLERFMYENGWFGVQQTKKY